MIFGEHNLNPEPQIKEWKDVEEYHTNIDLELGKATKSLCDYSHCSIQLLQKCIATLKIAKLIELSYGGVITDEEWKDDSKEKFKIVPFKKGGFQVVRYYSIQHKDILSFRERKLAEEFMSYESNRQLVEQYFMM